ncbi:sulfatase-like hydrolase/transferase [Rhodobacteraceae bacterium M382]|nr:sulfatase-like hydrolase/transferase [Rhodobacteraceae bacterium M382]
MTSNLLILMSDEHQARALGCAGHPLVQTPHLDALAGRGTRFTNAYTPSPICVPARASFATGRYVHQTRLWDNAMPYDGAIPGWGHALQRQGVPVESIGKLHYRSAEDPAGFDVEHLPMMVADGVGMVWASIRKEDERIMGKGRMLGEYIGPGQSKYTEYDAAVTARTRQWFQDRAASGDDRPWCLYVGLVAPHFPLVVPQEFYDLYALDRVPPSKLHPRDGHQRHPWVEKQNAFMDSEAKFTSEDERKVAIASYLGLCSWLDHNVGEILAALGAAGYGDNTTIAYTSDHGDNLGARGLWGKSNLYRESVEVPLILAGPDVPRGICDTPVSLVDLSHTIGTHFGADIDGTTGLRSLADVIAEPPDPDRPIFSEYHAAGAVSGAFMLRQGRWKYHHYIGFAPELFDLETDPEETTDLAADPGHAPVVAMMEQALRAICDPDQTDAQAFADQADLITRHGGREAALALGAPGATPPPVLETDS